MPFAAPHACAEPGCPAVVTHTARCPAHTRAKAHADEGLRESARARGYTSKWDRERLIFLAAHPLCQCPECDEGRKHATPATVVDHIIPHRGDMELFWDRLNWQAMSKPCHDHKTWAESHSSPRVFEELVMPSDLALSRIPCVMVCGPPGGGKSAYVSMHATPDDVVIDMDLIKRGLENERQAARELPRAFELRNRMLRSLATDTEHRRAWFVIGAADPRERALWARRLGAAVQLCAPPLAECVARIEADPARAASASRLVEVAADWHDRNS